jgi:hypothetical protein
VLPNEMKKAYAIRTSLFGFVIFLAVGFSKTDRSTPGFDVRSTD